MFGWAVELTAEIEAALTTERDPEAEATPCPSWRPHAREGCDDTGKPPRQTDRLENIRP